MREAGAFDSGGHTQIHRIISHELEKKIRFCVKVREYKCRHLYVFGPHLNQLD